MIFDVLITESCKGKFWECLEPVDIVQLIGVFISFGIALITLFAARAAMQSARASKSSSEIAEKQLEEMNKQRIDSVRPEIFVKNMKYKHFYHEKLGMGIFSENENAPTGESINLNIFLDVVNIGTGHSKKNTILWSFDINCVLKKIKELQENNQFLIDFIEGEQIIINEGSPIFLSHDFIYTSPVFIINEEYKIQFPFSYTWSLSVLLYLLILKDRLSPEVDVLPEIKCEIKYFDVLENFNSKSFKISPKGYLLECQTSDNNISNYKLDVLFEVDEIIQE